LHKISVIATAVKYSSKANSITWVSGSCVTMSYWNFLTPAMAVKYSSNANSITLVLGSCVTTSCQNFLTLAMSGTVDYSKSTWCNTSSNTSFMCTWSPALSNNCTLPYYRSCGKVWIIRIISNIQIYNYEYLKFFYLSNVKQRKSKEQKKIIKKFLQRTLKFLSKFLQSSFKVPSKFLWSLSEELRIFLVPLR
jgi:hypothetical protein